MSDPVNIQILQKPPRLSLIGEGLIYQVQSKRDWICTKALVTLHFPDSPASVYNDNYFELTFMDKVIQFTFKDSPDESGTQIKNRKTTDTYTEYLLKIVTYLNKNYYLNKYYSVEFVEDEHYIDIGAKSAGEAYNIEMTASNITNMVATHYNAINSNQPSDYKIYISAMLPPSGSETEPKIVGEDIVPINSEQIAVNNISEWLAAQLETGFTWPFNTHNIISWPKACVQYYAHIAEYFNNEVKQIFKIENEEGNYVLPGNVSKQFNIFITSEEASGYFYVADQQTKFLTWAPNRKITHISVPEKLYYLIQDKGLLVEYKGYFSDSSEVIITKSIPAIALPGVVEIFAGADIVFDNYNKEELLKYDVYVKDDSGLKISEIRTFIIDDNIYQNIRSIIFKNSFGMFDAAHFTGDLTISDSVNSVIYNSYGNDDFLRKVFQSKSREEYKLSSGWVEKDYRKWLTELLLNREAYLIISDYSLPIIINDGKFVKHHDRDDLYSLEIVFTPAYDDEYYSKELEDERFVIVDENDDYIATENDSLFKTT